MCGIMGVKLDSSVHAAVLILLTVVPYGNGELETPTSFLQRFKLQTSTAKPVLKVTDYHVRCSVVSRYALTTVESTVWNQLHVNKEAAFEVDLSSSAFISNFTITSNGKAHVAHVKRRTDARKIYDQAKKQGKAAGLVATKEREVEKFRVAVNVPPGTRVSFSLTYEELLSRRLGRYELPLGLRPGQPVQNVSLDVRIAERSGFSFIKVLPLRTRRLLTEDLQDAGPPPSTEVQKNHHCAHVRYNPTIQQQRNISPRGLNADFIIHYDVDLKDPMGDIQVDDGYFVHYFAPRGLPVVPKDVVFVIDISGSMIGTKIKQTKAAMNTILSDLREGDYFNIITFSEKVHTWKKGRSVRATRQNVRDAKEFVRKMIAEGWTNINAAILLAAQLLSSSLNSSIPNAHRPSSHRVPMIIFLTDGEATSGVTESDVILRNAQNALGSASLFGLAFGDDADFNMLRRLAWENRGLARMVYEDDDAAVQLKDFYDEVASPLLADIQLSYLDEQAYDVTRSLFPHYFQGSELVVTGRLKPGLQNIKFTLSASDSKQKVKVENALPLAKAAVNSTALCLSCGPVPDDMSTFVHRLWAYLTIKELLVSKMNTSDFFTQRLLVEKATNLSLKYNFVTPVTSLVVIKPDIDEPEPTISSITTTRETEIGTTASSTNVANQPKTSSTEAKKSNASHNPNKSPESKSVPPHPPPSGLHTGVFANTSVSFNTTFHLPVQKSTTRPPKTTSTSRCRTSTSSTTITVKTKSTSSFARNISHSPKSSTSSPKSSRKIPVMRKNSVSPSLRPTTLATLVATTPSPRRDSSSVKMENPLAMELTTSPQDPQTFSSMTTSDATSDIHVQLEVATLMAPDFMLMPGMTDAPKLWEAARFPDVSSAIHMEEKDIELVKDYDSPPEYDYSLHYESYSEPVISETNSGPDNSMVRIFSSSVDGDPHFIVKLPKPNQNLCFTVNGKPGDVLRLLHDPDKEIMVDGHLILGPPKEKVDNQRTFFDKITITSAKDGAVIILTMISVVVEVNGHDIETLPTNKRGSVDRRNWRVVVDEHHGCWVELGVGVQFLVLFHHYSHPKYFQLEHLGFYIADGTALSLQSQGVLGQFQNTHLEVIRVADTTSFHHAQVKDRSLVTGLLKKGDELFPVTLQDRNLNDSSWKRHSAQCWVVPKVDVERLLGRSYKSYVVPRH